MSFKAGICALRLGFEPEGWDLSLKAGILAWRLRFEPRGWNLSIKAGGTYGEEGGEREISAMCESIGHRPLQADAQRGK